MKIFIHNYKGFGIHPSRCRVYVQEVGTQTWIGFEDMDEGTSVTNASEQIASEIVDNLHLNPVNCKFFEWYPQYEGGVDEVAYHWKGPIASNAEWAHYCDKSENPFVTGKFPFGE